MLPSIHPSQGVRGIILSILALGIFLLSWGEGVRANEPPAPTIWCVKSGDWWDRDIWSRGQIPHEQDHIWIPESFVVQVTTSTIPSKLQLDGTLRMEDNRYGSLEFTYLWIGVSGFLRVSGGTVYLPLEGVVEIRGLAIWDTTVAYQGAEVHVAENAELQISGSWAPFRGPDTSHLPCILEIFGTLIVTEAWLIEHLDIRAHEDAIFEQYGELTIERSSVLQLLPNSAATLKGGMYLGSSSPNGVHFIPSLVAGNGSTINIIGPTYTLGYREDQETPLDWDLQPETEVNILNGATLFLRSNGAVSGGNWVLNPEDAWISGCGGDGGQTYERSIEPSFMTLRMGTSGIEMAGPGCSLKLRNRGITCHEPANPAGPCPTLYFKDDATLLWETPHSLFSTDWRVKLDKAALYLVAPDGQGYSADIRELDIKDSLIQIPAQSQLTARNLFIRSSNQIGQPEVPGGRLVAADYRSEVLASTHLNVTNHYLQMRTDVRAGFYSLGFTPGPNSTLRFERGLSLDRPSFDLHPGSLISVEGLLRIEGTPARISCARPHEKCGSLELGTGGAIFDAYPNSSGEEVSCPRGETLGTQMLSNLNDISVRGQLEIAGCTELIIRDSSYPEPGIPFIGMQLSFRDGSSLGFIKDSAHRPVRLQLTGLGRLAQAGKWVCNGDWNIVEAQDFGKQQSSARGWDMSGDSSLDCNITMLNVPMILNGDRELKHDIFATFTEPEQGTIRSEEGRPVFHSLHVSLDTQLQIYGAATFEFRNVWLESSGMGGKPSLELRSSVDIPAEGDVWLGVPTVFGLRHSDAPDTLEIRNFGTLRLSDFAFRGKYGPNNYDGVWIPRITNKPSAQLTMSSSDWPLEEEGSSGTPAEIRLDLGRPRTLVEFDIDELGEEIPDFPECLICNEWNGSITIAPQQTVFRGNVRILNNGTIHSQSERLTFAAGSSLINDGDLILEDPFGMTEFQDARLKTSELSQISVVGYPTFTPAEIQEFTQTGHGNTGNVTFHKLVSVPSFAPKKNWAPGEGIIALWVDSHATDLPFTWSPREGNTFSVGYLNGANQDLSLGFEHHLLCSPASGALPFSLHRVDYGDVDHHFYDVRIVTMNTTVQLPAWYRPFCTLLDQTDPEEIEDFRRPEDEPRDLTGQLIQKLPSHTPPNGGYNHWQPPPAVGGESDSSDGVSQLAWIIPLVVVLALATICLAVFLYCRKQKSSVGTGSAVSLKDIEAGGDVQPSAASVELHSTANAF